MKINDILECFNKALDLAGNPEKIHYVAHSVIEKKIGPVKQATTIITLCDQANNTRKDIVEKSYTTSIPTGHEEVLKEETEKRALIEFITKWSHDKGFTG